MCVCINMHACFIKDPKSLLLWECFTLLHLNDELTLTRQCASDDTDVLPQVLYIVFCDTYYICYVLLFCANFTQSQQLLEKKNERWRDLK